MERLARIRAKQRGLLRGPASDVWQPQPGPQTAAYESEADVVGYGGSAGGGKTALLVGMAGTKHRRSILFRRVYPSLAGVIDYSREVFDGAGAYNESNHRWRLKDGRSIEFASCQYQADLKKFQGQPHDLIGIDEATEWPERFVRFLTGWNRTVDPGQKCRVLLTFNPPVDQDGEWVVRFFAPWLDPAHPLPAKDGELRWFAMVDGDHGKKVEREFATREDVPDGVAAKSRTFFHAYLRDNAYLMATDYGATIDSMPEPLRSILKGQFDAGREENPWQVIPTEWVKLAQARWQACERPDVPMSSLGVDVARGGKDQTVLSRRYGWWFAPLEKHPGKSTPDGPAVAALVIAALDGAAVAQVDVIGVGAAVYDALRAHDVAVVPVNFAAKSEARDKSGQLSFANLRAECYWKLREALDPVGEEQIALPPDPELLGDLCAPTFKVTVRGIQVESKEDISERIHRSTDCGDAVVMALREAAEAYSAFASSYGDDGGRIDPWRDNGVFG